MKKITRKAFAVCLSVVMAGTLLSATAFASASETVTDEGNEIAVVAVSQGDFIVIDNDQTIENSDFTGDIYIQKGATLTTSGTNTIDGDIYVFGTLNNTGKLTVNGTLHCLHYGSMMSAGNYDYGYFINSGSVKASVLDVTSGYLDTEIPTVEENDDVDDKIETDEETVADYTSCPGVAISVTIRRSLLIDEDFTFTSDDGATVSAVNTGKKEGVDNNGTFYTKTYSVTITEPGYHVITVKGQTTGASLTFTVNVSHDISYFEKVEPTCTEDGHEAYYQCTACKTMFADEDGNEEISSSSVVIPAFGHDWQDPEWSWSEDYSAATISRVCNTCETVEKEPATVTSVTTATCTEPGETTYTASVTLDGEEYTDERTAETEALGHDWGDVEWTWSEDHSSATASWTCNACGVKESLDAEVSSVTTDPTEAEDGSIVYTATVTVEDGSEITDTYVEDLPATGVANEPDEKENPNGESDSDETEKDEDETEESTVGTNTGTNGNSSSSSGYTGSNGSGSSGSSSVYSPQTDAPVNISVLWLIVAGFVLAGCAALALYKFHGVKEKN